MKPKRGGGVAHLEDVPFLAHHHARVAVPPPSFRSTYGASWAGHACPTPRGISSGLGALVGDEERSAQGSRPALRLEETRQRHYLLRDYR